MKTKMKGFLTLLLAFVVQISFAQEKTVTGVVSEESGPLPGVTVLVKGTTKGTQTDFDGKYSIKVKQGDILQFSYMGMTAVEKTVGASNTINVVMKQDANMLDEVVVTAYGTQTKESLTGSISEVKSDEFTKVPSGNAITGLSGKVAGVQIYSNSGQPGQAPTVRFRGIGSLNGSSAPLYVVDGIPFTESITTINPNDIESMSFVKDASAAALYGSRGANGVVIVTTKRGKSGKLRATLDLKTTYTRRAVKDYDVMTEPGEYFEAYHKVLKNNFIVNGDSEADAGVKASEGLLDGERGLVYNPYGGSRTTLVDPVTGKIRAGDPLWRGDWREYLFEDYSGVNSAYLSLAGGSEKTKYFMSLGNEDNQGYNINTGFKRTTLKVSVDSEISDALKAGLVLDYANRVQTGTLTNNITGNFAWVRNTAPIYTVYARDHATGEVAKDAKGNPMWDWTGVTSPNATSGRPYSGFSNPHALQSLNVNKSNMDNFSARAYGEYKFLDGFKFIYNTGYDLAFFNRTDYTNKVVGSAVDVKGRLYERYGRGTTFTNQQLLSYTKTFDDVHSIDVMLGHESSKHNFKWLRTVQKNQFLNDDLSPDFFAQPDGTDAIQGDYTNYSLEGFLGKIAYDYNDKYYANASFRRDGSSVFHPDNRWGNFYGAGLAWRISQEDFMHNFDWLDELKLKTSFGQLGNDIVFYPGTITRNYAPYLDQWSVTRNGTDFDINKTVIGNKELTWETTTNFNAGFEAELFDNRLRIESEYFVRKITDLLFNRPLPSSTGLPSVPENVMDMENRGIEFLVSYDIIRNNDLNWSIDLNATSYKNKITKLVPGKEHIDDGAYRWVEGGDVFNYYMREFLGVNTENGNAIWKTDIEIDPSTEKATEGKTETYSVATEYLIGKSALPDVYGGFSTNLTYKGFDLGLDFSFQIGGYAYDNIYSNGFDGGIGRNFHRDFKKTWTWDNKNAKLPRIDESTNNWNQFSTFFLEKADYLSLNNVSFGYTLPEKIVEKAKMSKVKIYANVNNAALWTASGRQGFDPRQRVTGSNNAVRYPSLRAYTLGLNINF